MCMKRNPLDDFFPSPREILDIPLPSGPQTFWTQKL